MIAENPDILNIELGAGCGNFGQEYYPDCFITDKKTQGELDNTCESHSIQVFSCDAHNIPANSDRFQTIIMCNPFRYGFRDRGDYSLLDELYRVAQDKGIVVILTNKSNPFSNPKKVKERVENYNGNNSTQRFTFDYQSIDAKKDYEGFAFLCFDGKRETTPTFKISLTCLKP